MIEALSRATAAGDDTGLHQQVQQLLGDVRRDMGGDR